MSFIPLLMLPVNDASATNMMVANVPSEPLNLTAEAVIDQVYLNWSLPLSDGGSPITEYRIYIWTNDTWPPHSVARWSFDDRENFSAYVDINNGLVGGVTNYFYVTAMNEIGESMKSNDANVTAFFIPARVQTTASWGDGYVHLYWAAPATDGGLPLTGYNLYRYQNVYNETLGYNEARDWVNRSFAPDQLDYIDTEVTNGLDYYFYATAVNSLGEGEGWGKSARPGSSSEVLELNGVVGDGYVNITWYPPISDGGGSIVHYKIYRTDQSSTYPYEQVNFTTDGAVTYYNDTMVRNGHQYYYTVYAVNSLGVESVSWSWGYSGTPHGIPPDPSGLEANWELNGEGKPVVNLTWSPPISSDYSSFEYSIYKSGGMFLKVKMTSYQPFYLDEEVFAGVAYTYYVTAGVGGSESGPTGKVTITPDLPLDAPQDLVAIPGYGYMNLSWQVPYSSAGVTEYRIYRGLSAGSLELVETVPSTVTSWNDTGQESGIDYHYAVRAVGPGGERSSSDVLEIRARGDRPGDPNLLNYILIGTALAAVVALALIWGLLKWERKRKLFSTFLVLVVAGALVLASVLFVDTGWKEPTYEGEWLAQPGDYFEWGYDWGETSMGMRVTIVSVGDTTMTVNLTMSVPDQAPVFMEQTWQKGSTMGQGLMETGTSQSWQDMFTGGSVVNETFASKWGYLWAKHTTMTMDEMYGMPVNFTIEMWEYQDVLLEMRISMKMEMMGFSTEVSMRGLQLLDTNVPQILYP